MYQATIYCHAFLWGSVPQVQAHYNKLAMHMSVLQICCASATAWQWGVCRRKQHHHSWWGKHSKMEYRERMEAGVWSIFNSFDTHISRQIVIYSRMLRLLQRTSANKSFTSLLKVLPCRILARVTERIVRILQVRHWQCQKHTVYRICFVTLKMWRKDHARSRPHRQELLLQD